MKYFPIFVLFLTFSMISKAQEAWDYELEEQVKVIDFIDNGTKLFIGANEYIYLFDAETGEKVYQIELEDYLENGLYNLVGTTFLVATDDETMIGYEIGRAHV